MEEIYRILKPKGSLSIKVPYWNSPYANIDPTHRRGFHEMTFHFFDPSKDLCKQRYYYTNARFKIMEEVFVLIPFLPYARIPFIKRISIKGSITKRIIGLIANIFSGIVLDLELKLIKITTK